MFVYNEFIYIYLLFTYCSFINYICVTGLPGDKGDTGPQVSISSIILFKKYSTTLYKLETIYFSIQLSQVYKL